MFKRISSGKLASIVVILLFSIPLFAQQPTRKDSAASPAPARYRVTTKPTVPAPVPDVPAERKTTSARNKPAPAAANTPSRDPFSKGNVAIIHRNYIGYTKSTVKEVANTDYDELRIGANAVYFFMNHIGIGLDASFVSNHSNSPGTKQNLTSWSVSPSITYGRMITDKIGAYIRFSAGPSRSRSYLKNSITPRILESKFTELRGTLGFPILLERGKELYVTPYFSYGQFEGDAEIHHIRDVNKNLGFRLESYLPTRKSGTSQEKIGLSAGRYKAGNIFLEYSTNSGFYSTTRHERQSTVQFADVKSSGKQIGLGFGTYFMDNLAGLLELGVGGTKIGNGQSAYKTSNFNIHPTIMGHVPVEGPLNNLLLQAGYNYTHTKLTGNTIQNKAFLGLRAGYNFFFTKNLALTPKIGYETGRETLIAGRNDKRISKVSGPAAELGIRAWLNWKWR